MRLDSETVSLTSAVQEGETTPSETFADFQEILASGIAAAQSGDRLAARRLLFQASGVDPRCEDIWMWLASISDYPEELLIFLGNALDINPENERARQWRASTRSLLAKTFVQRAVAANQEGSLVRAEQCIEQALAYDSRCALAWLWKASLAGDEDQKIEFLERALEIEPDNPDAKAALDAILTERSHTAFNDVRSAAAAGRRKKALELVNEFLRSEPLIADAWILRSHLSLGLGEKIESLQRALEIEPDNTTARSTYDFLVATVGDQPETASSLNVTHPDAEGEDVLEAAATGESQPVVDEPESTTPFIEKPLDSVFDLDVSPAPEDFVLAVSKTRDHAADDAQPEGETRESEQYFVQPIDAMPVDESSGDFENTLLETFDVDASHTDSTAETGSQVYEFTEFDETPEPSDALVFEELQPLDLSSKNESNSIPESGNGSLPVGPDYVEAPSSDDSARFDSESVETHFSTEVSPNKCPYCQNPNEPQAFYCGTCHAAFSLSDIESLLNNPHADRELIQNAVTQMEAEWNLRDFSDTELAELGIGYLNLGDYEAGVKYIQEASRLDPNNVILGGQLNAIAIRIDEIRRQTEVHGNMPKCKRILVVDDSPTVRKLIASKLEKSGHEVTCAVDGVEALERLETSLPDLVLLDISMPRMDGYEVCKQIRTNPAAKDLPVIMISGKDGFFDKVRGRMAGSTGYVTKPFGPETLMKALETYLLPDQKAAD